MRKSLFDIQINGFAGTDFQAISLTVDEVRRAVEALAEHETLRFFPALITDAPERLEAKLAGFEKLRALSPEIAAAVCGYHLEGPWLSPQPGYRGAHDPRHMGPPDLRVFRRLQAAAGGHIKLVTLAPEWPGSGEFIRELCAAGVAVSLGHTAADDAAIDDAVAAGARFCTHLGNGVPAELPRHDNIIQRLLARDELTAFFIPDGIHLPPGVFRNFFRAKPPGRVLWTTDAMAAAAMPPGRYRLASLELTVGADGVVRSPQTGGFAGSALAPDDAVAKGAGWLRLPSEHCRPLLSTAVAEAFGVDLPDLL
jgi:N-acetylglucosamine-6-phosphate deacetylase